MVAAKISEVSAAPIVVLDGVEVQLENPDLDGDGVVGGVERLRHSAYLDQGVAHIKQESEIAQAMDRLDRDEVDEKSQMTSIDQNANLNELEKNGFGVIDYLVSSSFLPGETQYLTRRFKRLSVSVNGMGRKQKVEMVTGEREHQRGLGGSMIDRVRGLFSKSDDSR